MSKRINTSFSNFVGATKRQKINHHALPESSDDTSDSGVCQPPNKLISDKLKTMINSSILADVKFTFKNETKYLFAHKLILSVNSSKFAKMFRNTWQLPNTIRVINIDNCSSSIFEEILRFCYTDIANFDKNNVHEVMAFANAYQIKELEDVCCVFCLKYLNTHNVCIQYKKCYMLDNKLSQKCLSILYDNILHVMDNQNFFVLNKTSMTNVLQSDALNVIEYDLFNAVQKKIDDIPVDCQREILKCIRFGIMSTEEADSCFARMLAMKLARNDIISIIKLSSRIKRSIFVDKSITLKNVASSSNPQHVSLEFKVPKNVKIKSFYLDNHDLSCDYSYKNINDYIYYGLCFKENGKIIYECERATYYATPVEPIALNPNNHYILDTWASRHLEIRDCKCNYHLYGFGGNDNGIAIDAKGQTYVVSINCSVSEK